MDVERLSFLTVFGGYDSWIGSFDANGGAVVLLECRLLPVCGPRQCRPQLGLQLVAPWMEFFDTNGDQGKRVF